MFVRYLRLSAGDEDDDDEPDNVNVQAPSVMAAGAPGSSLFRQTSPNKSTVFGSQRFVPPHPWLLLVLPSHVDYMSIAQFDAQKTNLEVKSWNAWDDILHKPSEIPFFFKIKQKFTECFVMIVVEKFCFESFFPSISLSAVN